jgi:Hexapeptide repeat of succinyl-transferase
MVKRVKARARLARARLAKEQREDVLSETSRLDGAGGVLESFLRKFRTVSFIFLLTPVILMCVCMTGASLVPSIYFFTFVYNFSVGWATPLHYFAIGVAIFGGYLIYGLTLIFVVPFVNFLLPFRVKPFRGIYYSLPAIPWYVHNALTYIVRYTFLEFITPSPLNLLYFRMMGMKIGKGCVINSSNISDPCMISLGDYVTIGGSATIFAHYGQKGYMIISPVRIGDRTTIGLKASVMGGVSVGNDCNIKPHTALLPKTEVPDNTTV